jgi:hypothetical protein
MFRDVLLLYLINLRALLISWIQRRLLVAQGVSNLVTNATCFKQFLKNDNLKILKLANSFNGNADYTRLRSGTTHLMSKQ